MSAEWPTILGMILGPAGSAYVGLKVAVNGMREDVKELKEDSKGMRDDIGKLKEDVAFIRGTRNP